MFEKCFRGGGNSVNPSGSEALGSCGHSEVQHLQSAECWLKTQAVCKTFQPNEDTFNANVVIGKRKYPVKISKELSCKKSNYIEINNQLDCFGSKEPHNDVNSCNACKISRKVAFTLAEVLITLGIIGVVVALTLPTLIQNYQKHVTVTKLQKAYSSLGQVAQKAFADNGSLGLSVDDKLDETLVKDFFYTYWIPYFKGAKVDTSKWGPWEGSNLAYKYKNGSQYNVAIYTNFSAGRIFFTTSDGASYFVMISHWQAADKYIPLLSSMQEVVVDINGLNPPNIFGKDIFRFWIDFENGKVVPDQYKSSDDSINSNCSKSGIGTACSTKIIRDGWQIKYAW